MKQHPIPQDITNYKFHLIGSMTLKQFAYVAVAVVLGFIVYKTNLIGMIKWPLIFFTVGLGAMIAFVPIEERPLDHWISTFFKKIYKPTKFFWKKSSKIPDFFNYQITSTQSDYFAPNVNLNPARKQRIFEYLKSIPSDEVKDDFDLEENQKISELLNTFYQVEVSPEDIKIETPKQVKPDLKTRVRKLQNPTTIANTGTTRLPNQVFGSIFDQNNNPTTEALIELKNQAGQSLRISKSDAEGNFTLGNPLEDGLYEIIAEKDGYIYPPIKLELNGQILQPIVITT